MNKLENLKNKSSIKVYFEVKSKIGRTISTTKNYWNIITRIKHPTLWGKEREVKHTLINPDEIRVSKKSEDIILFYKKWNKIYLCVVSRMFKKRGFIVTAYYTKKIKEGKLRWKR